MGGGGGSFGSGYNPRDIAREVRDVEKSLESDAFKTRLGDMLAGLLGDYNDRDKKLVRQRLDDILVKLGKLADGELDLVFGGSVAKNTYIEGLSDIDCLLILNGSGLDKKNPQDVLADVAKELGAKLSGTATAEAGDLAVTVTYQDGMEIQLVPAIKAGDSMKIPSSRTEGKWSDINPEKFREGLTKYNKRCADKLVPTIKLAKAVIAQLPEAHQLSGYHIESLAIDAFKSYQGPKTPAAMLPHFFEHAKEGVMRPMTDSTGQSVHVDGYLGAANSEARQNASHLLERIWKRMANASAAGSLPQWQDLFGEDQ